MSIGAVVEPDGSLSEMEITPSTVMPTHRLSYHQADELLLSAEDNGAKLEIMALHNAAKRRSSYRDRNGAVSIDLPECNVHVTQLEGAEEEPIILVEPELTNSPSGSLVTEMMVMAGEVVGNFCNDNRIPVPYRCQADVVLPSQEDLANIPPGPCHEVAKRRRMTRSSTSTDAAGRHSGLGLEAYVQFTSPIRRYGDLLAHWQVKAFLRGSPCPYNAEELAGMLDSVQSQMQQVHKVDREIRNYWLSVYFQQRMGETWDATFLCWARQDVGMAQLLIESLGLEVVQRLDRPVSPGQMLRMQCTEVNLRQCTFKLEECKGTL
ncbi:putative ribonuclease sll1290 [Convolutriloba macropyga]|uniref:putative ribonuclease sll1290 n=1 Tax=Convolutriloba macropyga TaxID=536237 RepID=UPI003F5265A6